MRCQASRPNTFHGDSVEAVAAASPRAAGVGAGSWPPFPGAGQGWMDVISKPPPQMPWLGQEDEGLPEGSGPGRTFQVEDTAKANAWHRAGTAALAPPIPADIF